MDDADSAPGVRTAFYQESLLGALLEDLLA